MAPADSPNSVTLLGSPPKLQREISKIIALKIVTNIEDITWARGDTNFIFEC
jgi:hypothetical protein